MNEYLVGIDIGSSKVCAAVGKLDKYDKLQVIGITSVKCNGLKKSVVVDIDDTASSIRECIEQLQRMIDINIKDVYISLPGQISELIWSKGVVAISSDDREIKEYDVNRVLEAAKLITVPSDKEIIGVIPVQYIVDGYENIKDPIGMSGLRLEVEAQIIVSKSTIINNILKSVNKAGINVAGIVLQPLAVSQTVLNKEQMDMGTAIVDVGAETTDISVLKYGNLLGTYTIPLGGSNITSDISLCLKIPYSDAERGKIKYGNLDIENIESDMEKVKVSSPYGNDFEIDYVILNQVIKARVDEILFFIRKKLIELDNYEEISEIVLVGGGISLIKGIEKMAREILGKSVRIGLPEFTGANSPLYVTSVGIVNDVAYSLKDIKDADLTYNSKVKSKKKESLDEKDGNAFLTKIRQFLTDFF